MTFAIDKGNVLIELFEHEPHLHPSINVVNVSAIEGVAAGWVKSGETYIAPAVISPTKDELIAFASFQHAAWATGGITVGTWPVATDPLRLAILDGATAKAVVDNTFTVNWVTPTTGTVVLTAAQIISINDAVVSFIQAAYTKYGTIIDGILGNSITTYAQISAEVWPSRIY